MLTTIQSNSTSFLNRPPLEPERIQFWAKEWGIPVLDALKMYETEVMDRMPSEYREMIQAKFDGGCSICGTSMFCEEEIFLMTCVRDDVQHRQRRVAELGTQMDILCPKCIELRGYKIQEAKEVTRRTMAMDHVTRHKLWLEDSYSETFENCDVVQRAYSREEWQYADEWNTGKPCLWITGFQGRGKTYMAHAIANRELLERGNTIAELGCGGMHNFVGQFWFRDQLKLLFGVRVLVLDDIDKTADAMSLETLWSLLDERNKRRVRTIITANMDPAKFQKDVLTLLSAKNESYPRTFMERLNWPNTVCHRLELKGPSMRRRNETATQGELV